MLNFEQNFLFKCNQFSINAKFRDHKIEFSYSDSNESNDFRQLCHLNLDKSLPSSFRTFDSSSRTPCFVFFLLNKSQRLSAGLFKSLFNAVSNTKQLPADAQILLIGSNDGYVYWHPLGQYVEQALNNKILLNTSSSTSSVILMDTFRYSPDRKSPFSALFNDKNARSSHAAASETNESANCLFAVSKCGRLYLFSFIDEFSYKVCMLAHNVAACVKFSQNELIYCCTRNNVYSVQLSHCFDSTPIKARLIKSNCRVKRFLIGLEFFDYFWLLAH